MQLVIILFLVRKCSWTISFLFITKIRCIPEIILDYERSEIM